MSRKIYDYDKCYEIAKQCSCSSEMRKKNMSAYNVALKHKWIKDYYWFKRKQHTPYTYEEVYEIAKQYDCSSDFQRGNGSAYDKARKNGWIKDYTWFKIKQHSPYTYEECFEVAKNYKTRLELFKGNIGVYQAALHHGWLDDYTWFESKQNPYNYWTKERVIEESKKYKNRGDFHDNCGTAYGKARVNGWLDELIWLKDDRIDFSSDKIDCVYAYEFKSLNSVYVGRTLERRIEERDKEHMFNDKDAVYLFAKKNGVPVPKMKILEDNLILAEGVKKEGYYVECYRKNGWEILNRTKTGGIGKIGSNKWNKATCYEEALKYKTRGEFAEYSAGAYDVARRNGWLDNYTWFEEKQKPSGYWDCYDNCYAAALTCRTKTEFHRKFNAGYTSAQKHDWFKDYSWFNIKRTAHNKKWDSSSVYEEAKKYKTKTEFSRKKPGAYHVARINGWIDSYDWFEESASLQRKQLIASWEKRKKWTYDICKQIAKESKGRLDFRRRSASAYTASIRHNWLDDFFPKKK